MGKNKVINQIFGETGYRDSSLPTPKYSSLHRYFASGKIKQMLNTLQYGMSVSSTLVMNDMKKFSDHKIDPSLS